MKARDLKPLAFPDWRTGTRRKRHFLSHTSHQSNKCKVSFGCRRSTKFFANPNSAIVATPPRVRRRYDASAVKHICLCYPAAPSTTVLAKDIIHVCVYDSNQELRLTPTNSISVLKIKGVESGGHRCNSSTERFLCCPKNRQRFPSLPFVLEQAYSVVLCTLIGFIAVIRVLWF